jgi:hypothetical protein
MKLLLLLLLLLPAVLLLLLLVQVVPRHDYACMHSLLVLPGWHQVATVSEDDTRGRCTDSHHTLCIQCNQCC